MDISDKTKVNGIRKHLQDKHRYTEVYIDRVCGYMEANPDLADEFYRSLPKNTILDHFIEVNGISLRTLGATTLLSRSAIYTVLARLRSGDGPAENIIAEELQHLAEGTSAA